MLPMLTVSGAPGLIYLNGRLCGETGIAAMPLAADGVQYLELRPFDPAQPGAVLRLNVEDGRLTGGLTGDVFAVQWPNGWIAMEMRRDTGTSDELPQPVLLAQLSMPGGQYLLVSEDGTPLFGRDADEAVFLPADGVLHATLRPLNYPELCAAEGTCADGQFAAVLRAADTPALEVCAVGTSATVDAYGALHCVESVDDLVGHAWMYVYVPDARGHYTLHSRDPAWLDGGPHWPASPGDTARAWLEALRVGADDEAAGYLLRPGDAPRLFAVAGAFDAVVALPPDGSDGVRWGVMRMVDDNLAMVRRLDFTMARQPSAQGEWKIDQIAEGVCD